MTTKAERIRQLLAAGMCNTMIAEIVGTREEYVRVVKQRLDPRRQEMDRARSASQRLTSNPQIAHRAWAIHYRDARARGMTVGEARKLGERARKQSQSATCDKAAARAAYHAAKRGANP